MNVCDLVMTEHRAPGRHRTTTMEHGFSKRLFIFEDGIACQFRARPADGYFTLASWQLCAKSLAPLDATPVTGPSDAAPCAPEGSIIPDSVSMLGNWSGAPG
jgi:hypothetical protein